MPDFPELFRKLPDAIKLPSIIRARRAEVSELVITGSSAISLPPIVTTDLTMTGTLSGPADPAGASAGSQVGDRDYNDARYIQQAWGIYGSAANLTLSAAISTYENVVSLSIPNAGTWLVWAQGSIEASTGAAVTWRGAIRDGTTVKRYGEFQAAAGSVRGNLTIAAPVVTTGATTIYYSVYRSSTSGTQIARECQLMAIRVA